MRGAIANFARRVPPIVWLALLVLAVLAPFLHKAFHIDDPLFIWMAQQIDRQPLNPYGFAVNWSSYPRPMWEEMQNPPLCSYYISVLLPFFGTSEVALHAAFLVWPVLAVTGVYQLARRLCDAPFTVALLTLCTPVFLISATNVMCDVMLLALFVWAIEFWLFGFATNKIWPFLLATMLASLALLTKYFGVALVPLLFGYSLFRDRGFRWRTTLLLIPVAIAAGYELLTKAAYGRGLFFAAGNAAYRAWDKWHLAFGPQTIVGLCFVGGCLFTAILFLRGGVFLLLLGTVGAGIAAFSLFVPINPDWALGTNTLAVQIEGGIFAGVGISLLVLAVQDFWKKRNADSLLLLLWMTGTFVFVTFLNWSITARTILPLAPPTALLVLRHSIACSRAARAIALSVAATVSIAVTAADFVQANSARTAAQAFRNQFRGEPASVWFQSHWGFQYYMQRWGAYPTNVLNFRFSSKDIIIIPANNTGIRQIDVSEVFTPEQFEFPLLPWITTFARSSGACFYSSTRGPLPWAIDRVPPEMFYVARFR